MLICKFCKETFVDRKALGSHAASVHLDALQAAQDKKDVRKNEDRYRRRNRDFGMGQPVPRGGPTIQAGAPGLKK